jgi:hypothetical protein
MKVEMVKVIPEPMHHTMKIDRGCGSKAPCILDLISRWRWVARCILQLLYLKEKVSTTTFKRLKGPHSLFGCYNTLFTTVNKICNVRFFHSFILFLFTLSTCGKTASRYRTRQITYKRTSKRTS